MFQHVSARYSTSCNFFQPSYRNGNSCHKLFPKTFVLGVVPSGVPSVAPTPPQFFRMGQHGGRSRLAPSALVQVLIVLSR